MGKRSPILGYNHNVRYRGLVFHVQTEDSGVATPHLFTHLFHSGVIVSTRKLDYDAGSAEESIKALMQAQHKAVLKDLRRGQFDDKIDSYLGGTPGLLPRGAEEPAERASEAELVPSQGTVEELAAGAPTEQMLPIMLDEPSAPVAVADKTSTPVRVPAATSSPVPVPVRPAGRTNGGSGSGGVPVPAPAARSHPTPLDATLRTAAPAFEAARESDRSGAVAARLPEDSSGAVAAPRRLRDTPGTRGARDTRDTEAQMPVTDPARPTLDLDEQTRPTLGIAPEDPRRIAAIGDRVPGARRPTSPAIPPPLPSDSRRLGDRPSTINAATLPPARPISRPASRPMLSPQVAPRPPAPEDRRRELEDLEAYAPSAPPAELPPGERPGQYAQLKKVSPRSLVDAVRNERPGSVPVPAGLGRPQRPTSAPSAKPGAPVPVPGAVPAPVARESSRNPTHTEPLRGRVPTPPRVPATSRPASASSGGVVMTRPALIVGAPAKTVATVPRIRKAREDEGRGFGQGLISEKSLDEVILAYLSEDADEK